MRPRGAVGLAVARPTLQDVALHCGFPLMARCEQGYLCEVCGLEVAEITDSDLYLRYVLGEVPPEQLHLLRERHIRCNPTLAQYITDPAFHPPLACEGFFAKQNLDPAFVS